MTTALLLALVFLSQRGVDGGGRDVAQPNQSATTVAMSRFRRA